MFPYILPLYFFLRKNVGELFAFKKFYYHTFSEVTVYTIYSQNSVSFLYTNGKQFENEVRETTPFITDSNNIKYLGKLKMCMI